ncbi:MAG: PD40 domain-containing protein [Bacteroidales bacterium]|nr:PD40 domain-containing protein [Bacteroidales bacterium]
MSVLTAATLLSACNGSKGTAGRNSFEIGEYDRALSKFSKAYSSEKNRYTKGEYAFYLAECYRIKGMNKKAATNYNRAIRAKFDRADAQLRMADCLRATGDFEGAREAYLLYQNKNSTSLLARNGLASCDLAEPMWKYMNEYDYKNAPDSGYIMSLAKQFNSKFSDYSPAFVGDDYDIVYFTSMRLPKKHKRTNRVTGQGNSTIYISRLDGRDNWTYPEPLEEPFSSQIDDGTPSLTPDGKVMYFTRCPYDPEQQNTAQCFEIKRSGGRWSDPVRVIPGGDSTMMVAHPAISPDGNTLYFVSDAAGGIGGKDIYKTEKGTDGKWTKAENLGAIVNTQGDEMFPYVRSNGTLYFSSNGHPGYGGLDIYKAEMNENGNHVVSNLGVPINSFGDDFGIVFAGNREEGFLSSNRANAKGVDNIYSFVMPEVVLMLEGSVRGNDGGVPQKSFVRIIGDDGSNNKIRLGDDGKFGQRINPGTEYIILCGAKGYINKKLTLSTKGKSRSETVRLDAVLDKQ